MRDKSVVVAGAGGNIGSHLTESLARMPNVGRITLIDRDVYELRNALNQNIVARDIGKSKALVQALRLQEIDPNLEVHALHTPLENLPLGAWRSDLIVSCLDSRAARQVVNERAWRLGVPWADAGVLGAEWLARVNIYRPEPDAPCLECAWADEDYRLLEQQYPCAGGARAHAPNGASAELGALAAAMLALECRKVLTGDLECAAVSRQVTFNARRHRFSVTSFRRNPACRFDHAQWIIEPFHCHIGRLRLRELPAIAESIRAPGQRFIRRLVCPACGSEKRLFCLSGAVDDPRLRCGSCGHPMVAPGFDTVEALEAGLRDNELSQTLDETGLRYGDVLEAGGRYFEITSNVVIGRKK